MMRQSLRQLYGLEGTPLGTVRRVWKRVLVGDFGPSLSAFPTPVSQLILRALPWTVGLLLVSTLLTWVSAICSAGLRAITATAASSRRSAS